MLLLGFFKIVDILEEIWGIGRRINVLKLKNDNGIDISAVWQKGNGIIKKKLNDVCVRKVADLGIILMKYH